MDRPRPVPSPAGSCREERIEHLVLHLGRDTRSIVADADFHTVGKAPGAGQKRRLEALTGHAYALRRRVKPVGDHVEQRPRDLLRVQLDLAGAGVEVTFERDLEVRTFGARSVIGRD
jgi:hypothetical protein